MAAKAMAHGKEKKDIPVPKSLKVIPFRKEKIDDGDIITPYTSYVPWDRETKPAKVHKKRD